MKRRDFIGGVASIPVIAGTAAADDDPREDPHPAIVMTYDDGKSETYTDTFPVHQEYGVPGTVAMVSSDVGTSGCLSLSQLEEMESAGWEIQSHGVKHRYMGLWGFIEPASAGDTTIYLQDNRIGRFSGDKILISEGSTSEIRQASGTTGSDATGEYITLSSGLNNSYTTDATVEYARETIQTEMGKSHYDLNAMGLNVTNMIYPGGSHTATTREIARQYYDSVGIGGPQGGWQTPPFDLHQMSRVNMETDKMTDTEMKNWLDEVKANNALGLAAGHPQRTSVMTPERVGNVIQWAMDRNIDILTYQEAFPRFGYHFQSRCSQIVGTQYVTEPAESDNPSDGILAAISDWIGSAFEG